MIVELVTGTFKFIRRYLKCVNAFIKKKKEPNACLIF